MMLNFEDEVMVLATIRAIGIRNATALIARVKRKPAPTVRTALEKLDSHSFLVAHGLVKVSDAGVLTFTELSCPQQSFALTQEYFYSCTVAQQNDLNEAFVVLRCGGLCRDIKPLPIKAREPRYAKKTETTG